MQLHKTTIIIMNTNNSLKFRWNDLRLSDSHFLALSTTEKIKFQIRTWPRMIQSKWKWWSPPKIKELLRRKRTSLLLSTNTTIMNSHQLQGTMVRPFSNKIALSKNKNQKLEKHLVRLADRLWVREAKKIKTLCQRVMIFHSWNRKRTRILSKLIMTKLCLKPHLLEHQLRKKVQQSTKPMETFLNISINTINNEKKRLDKRQLMKRMRSYLLALDWCLKRKG